MVLKWMEKWQKNKSEGVQNELTTRSNKTLMHSCIRSDDLISVPCCRLVVNDSIFLSVSVTDRFVFRLN